MSRLVDMLTRFEGVRLKPYVDTRGRATIGIGRCLDTTGISEVEARMLLSTDIARAERAAHLYDWYYELSHARQDAIVAMIFQLGAKGFSEFEQMIAALKEENWAQAARAALDSDWAEQTPARAREISKMILTGKYAD